MVGWAGVGRAAPLYTSLAATEAREPAVRGRRSGELIQQANTNSIATSGPLARKYMSTSLGPTVVQKTVPELKRRVLPPDTTSNVSSGTSRRA